MTFMPVFLQNGGIVHDQKRSGKDRSWLPVIAAAAIGAVATIVAALVANGTGALSIAVAPVPTRTVTVTPAPAPVVTVTNTVTVTKSSGGSNTIGPTSCPSGQTCRAWNLSVQLGASNSSAGVNFDTGVVNLQGSGDLDFEL